MGARSPPASCSVFGARCGADLLADSRRRCGVADPSDSDSASMSDTFRFKSWVVGEAKDHRVAVDVAVAGEFTCT